MADRLVVRGAREHNLKDVSLDLPRDALIVFTGLSGSGKSSLAFDTIFAEGQRRYVESLSAYARQFLGQMDKPDVDFIDGLSPAVSIDQKAAGRNPRSTVGTITEVYDYLRLLYARVGKPHCPVCGRPIARQSPQQIVDRVLELDEGTRFQVLAPVVRGRKGEYGEMLRDLQAKGYSRARVDGVVIRLDSVGPAGELPALRKYEKHDIEVVVDRLDVKDSARRRLTDSVETALALSGGVVVLDFVDLPENDPHRERMFSEHLACLYDDLSFDELEPRSFSFNSPWGACPDCTGLGTRMEVDPELVVSDPDRTLAEGAIGPWSGGHVSDYFLRLIEALGDAIGFSTGTPWNRLPAAARTALLRGYDKQVHVRYKNRYGRERSYYTHFEGAIPYIERRHSEAESDSSRERYAGFMREVPCPVCRGARLKPVSLAVTVDAKSIAEFCALPIGELAKRLLTLELSDRDQQIAGRILKEVNSRLGFLLDVGLDYLTLDRASATLAGGEAQRIRLATQIGSGLVGVLYVLDEPSIGLHQRDNHRLLETLIRLRDLGNTLIVVEHDEDTIRAADWVVDIGPRAGEHGGNIVVSGPLPELLASQESLTGAYLTGRESIPLPSDAPQAVQGPGGRGQGGQRAQPARRGRGVPARLLHRGHRRVRVRQVHAGQRHPVQRAGQGTARHPDRAGQAHAGHRACSTWTRSCTSTRARSAARRGPTRPPTPACSTTSAGCSRRPPRPRSAATSRAGSRSTSRAAGARRARATARSRSRCSSCPTCTCRARSATAPATTPTPCRCTTRARPSPTCWTCPSRRPPGSSRPSPPSTGT